ncbi:MAG TPA: diaminopimelate decarboxylase [Bryobacteraceae bacterium]|nr:diaminopimelate decarboxylase [Bryobacteraceae bacterium]
MLIDGEFFYRGNALVCEDTDLSGIARIYGTPTYVYSKQAVVSRFRAYRSALDGLPHRVCYAVKANSNLALLSVLAREGAGFDIVSGGELYRVLNVDAPANTVVFSGVGKTETEIRFALQSGIHSFNCESEEEVGQISRIAVQEKLTASIAVRVNPDVNAVTHPYISTGLREHKFGVDMAQAPEIYSRAAGLPGIVAEGVSCHIGSQILEADPLLEAAEKMLSLVKELRSRGLPIRYLDLGGGLGVPYRASDTAMPIHAFIERLRTKLDGLGLTLMLEPGRSIVAEAGVLLTRVLLVKKNGAKIFVIVDAGMNDLIRPALYQAHHEILPVERDVLGGGGRMTADVVGPVCETGDFFARNREMPEVKVGDLLAVCTSGAYGFVLASNYNSRPRACELLVSGDRVHVARERETYADLVRGEHAVALTMGRPAD